MRLSAATCPGGVRAQRAAVQDHIATNTGLIVAEFRRQRFPPACQAAGALETRACLDDRALDLASLVWKAIGKGKSPSVIADEFNESGIAPLQRWPWAKKFNIADRATSGRKV
jgi:hypothetical protein